MGCHQYDDKPFVMSQITPPFPPWEISIGRVHDQWMTATRRVGCVSAAAFLLPTRAPKLTWILLPQRYAVKWVRQLYNRQGWGSPPVPCHFHTKMDTARFRISAAWRLQRCAIFVPHHPARSPPRCTVIARSRCLAARPWWLSGLQIVGNAPCGRALGARLLIAEKSRCRGAYAADMESVLP